MIKYLKYIAIGAVALGLTACASLKTPVSNTVDVGKVDFSKEMKQGNSCQYYLFGLVGPFGDASVVNATKEGGISKIDVVDHKNGWYVLVSQQCVMVYGQ